MSGDEPSLRPQAASFLPLNPLDFLDRAGIVYPDKIAVVSGPRTIIYGDFRDRAARVAGAILAVGIPPGGTVSVL